uniref:TBC1 domain family member 22A isoform X6 n=1 Tax=Ictidomys tridecemlineatus TaxID=43179 RepID=UPI001A9D1148|nr:TBC1 domain family member 22A isoform X6 [Ictidomys tridecemlineatus]
MPRGRAGWSTKTLKGCFLAETLEGRCLKTGKAFQGEECKGPVVRELQKCLRNGSYGALALVGWGEREKAGRVGSGQVPVLRKPDEGSLLSSGHSVKPLGGLEPGLVKLGRKDHEEFHQSIAWGLGLEELRKLSWSGIPKPVRPITWKLLSGYLPANVDRRPATLQRKQKEYFAFIEHYYDSRNDEAHQDTYRQIHIDIPRMSPEALILQPKVTEIFERILFIWAIRHPASGYVQGINDLVTPFFVVFICEYIEEEDVDAVDVSSVPEEVLRNIEADTYWCMSKLLDGIQDNYTFAQPGIQMKVKMLEELVSRIDEQVHRHLDQHEVRYLQFAFRWMNNLLMREVPLRCTVRLWDTYQSEPEGFSHFHLYVCAAFLVRWRKEILEERDFQELLLFLQNLPTARWGDEDISLLLAEAYRLKFVFADAPNHYKK